MLPSGQLGEDPADVRLEPVETSPFLFVGGRAVVELLRCAEEVPVRVVGANAGVDGGRQERARSL